MIIYCYVHNILFNGFSQVEFCSTILGLTLVVIYFCFATNTIYCHTSANPPPLDSRYTMLANRKTSSFPDYNDIVRQHRICLKLHIAINSLR